MATDSSGMVRINMHITQQQEARLLALKQESGLSVAELMRRALDFYVPFAHRLGVHEMTDGETEETS